MSKIAQIVEKTHDFIRIVSAVDKVQRYTINHDLTAGNIRRSLDLYNRFRSDAISVYVTCITAYSFSGYKYKSCCSTLIISPQGFTVKRGFAPEKENAKGPLYTIDLIVPSVSGESIETRGFFILYRSEDRLTFFCNR